MAGIHPLVEHVDEFAASRAVHSCDQDHHLEFRAADQLHLSLEQRLAQGGNFLSECRLVDALTQFRRFEHGKEIGPAAAKFNGAEPLIRAA